MKTDTRTDTHQSRKGQADIDTKTYRKTYRDRQTLGQDKHDDRHKHGLTDTLART